MSVKQIASHHWLQLVRNRHNVALRDRRDQRAVCFASRVARRPPSVRIAMYGRAREIQDAGHAVPKIGPPGTSLARKNDDKLVAPPLQ